MDFTSIIGLIIGSVLILYGIGTKNLNNFYDLQSIVIVLGGTFAAVTASFPFRVLKHIPSHMKILCKQKKYNPIVIIDKLVELAETARKNGLLSLEETAKEIKDPFFKHSILLIVDAMDPTKIRNLLEVEIENMSERHEEQIAIYDKGAGIAPAFGMIGTLVGLVNMLKELDLERGGASNLGNNMSVALITTFYGCLLANLVFIPIASKLRVRNEEELLYKRIIIEGVLSIQSGDNPKFIREKLLTYIDEKRQVRIISGKEEGKSREKVEE